MLVIRVIKTDSFREYALKIALARSTFQPKMHYISFGGLALPGPAGGSLQLSPDPLAGFKGAYF